jgi:hypothetical protein
VIVLAGALLATARDAGPAAGPLRSAVPAASTGAATTATSWEHRYRVSGKVRLLLFWAGDNDVGGARMRVEHRPGSQVISFFGGSDPARAPRRLNMWGYAVEHAEVDSARVFMLRSMGEPDPAAAEARLADGGSDALFGASCGTMDPTGALASITGVRVGATVTYRAFGEVLSAVSASPRWQTERAHQTAHAAPGFFTALQDTISEAMAAIGTGTPLPQTTRKTYLYKGLPYELRVLKMQRERDDVVRARYLYVNPPTADSGQFTVLFGASGPLAGVPLRFSVQPNWWLRLELELDDRVDVPEEPTHNEAVARAIEDICTRALSADRARLTD